MKYNYFQDEKLEYEDIEIPDELLFMVRQTVAADRRKKAAARRMRIVKTAGSAAAVLFLCLTIGVNSSYAFAETAVKIPIVKGVAKAVVMRSYRPEIIAVYEENRVSSRSEKVPEETPGQQPEEIMPAASGNDVPLQTEIPEQQPAEQTPAEVPEGFDDWKAEMTPEKLKEVTEVYTPDMEERYGDAPEKLRTILLGELPEKDISLYGYHEDGKVTGTALRIGNTCQYFNWNYMNESRELPDIFCEDINGDGTEEVIVLLYNGSAEKKVVPEEISKEDIAAPGGESGESAGGTVSGNSVEEKTGEKLPAVSGNEVQPPESKEEYRQPAGELWVVSPKGESWTATVLSTDDYESQILHELKAAYDAQTGEIQLYRAEEPFGDPVMGPAGLTFEAVNVAAGRSFIIKKGISLQFQMEVTLLKEDGEKVYVLSEPQLKAGVVWKDDTLTIEKIQEM